MQLFVLTKLTYLIRKFGILILCMLCSWDVMSQCSGTVYDPGGSGANYPNNANNTVTYTATTSNSMKLTFTSFNTEVNYDKLQIYDGPNTSSTLIATVSGNLTSALPGPYTSTGQTITLKFTSDGSVTAAGYSINLSCVASCNNTTSGGTIAGNQSGCASYDPTILTSSSAASGGSGTLSYQWENSINNSTWNEIAGATSDTYDPSTITQTTYYRRKSIRSGCSGYGAISNTITKTVLSYPVSNAGTDITQCESGGFQLTGNTPSGGQTVSWSIVSGTPLTSQSTTNSSIVYTINSGTSATLRYTVSNGTCSSTDDVVISNTTGCATDCIDPLNINGDLETEGNATSFPLSFQSTPAALINSSYYVPGWADRYGNATPNTSSFTGAYYIKKTGVNGDPHSGAHMVYLAGNSFCYSALSTSNRLACGKTYKFVAWIAAYTNGGTQQNSPFALEFSSSSSSGNPSTIATKLELNVAASTSWNNLNWQRYEFFINIPANGYEWADYYFTPYSNSTGIVIDDVCITEVDEGSNSFAGSDILSCTNGFTLDADAVVSGYTGTWSVVSGSASFSSSTDPNAFATITSGTNATLRWTVTGGSCTSTDDVIISYNSGSPVTLEDINVCPGGTATLTANNCSGTLLWSTGATSSSISISPTSNTLYSVTCTSPYSTNLILNPGFESATNFQNWGNWANAGITTTSGEVRSGSKAARINASSAWGGFGQEIAATPGQEFTVSCWAKMTNTNSYGILSATFLNSSWNEIGTGTDVQVISTSYSKYTLKVVAPPNTAYIQISAEASNPSIMYVDDIEVYRTTACNSIAEATVYVTCPEICNNDIDDDGDGLTDCNDPDCGQITNREFNSGTSNWNLYNQNGAVSTFTIDNASQLSGNNSAKINITTSTGTGWHIQFAQTGKSIETGKTYKLSFMAKASSSRTISAAIDLGVSPFTTYHSFNASLTTIPESYSYTFTATTTQLNNIRAIFNLGANSGNVWIDNVTLNEVCTNFACPQGFCESANLIVNPNFESNINSWTATNGQLYHLTNGNYGNYFVLNLNDYANDYYVYQDVAFDANTKFEFTGYASKHATSNKSKIYLEFYNGTSLISKTADFNVSYNWNSTTNFQAITPFEGTTPPNTTKIRIVGYANGTALKLDELSLITCNPISSSLTGGNVICIGEATTVSPNSGGTWTSSNTGVATVTNSGVVIGVGAGTATFTFTNSAGCLANATAAVTVNAKPTVSITGATTICVGQTTTLSPTTGGTWISSDTLKATITDAGLVTGISAGTVTFTFRNSSTGCLSNPTNTITISALPVVAVTGTTTVCLNSTTTLSPTTGGTWTSTHPDIATVTNDGVVVGVAVGSLSFLFTSSTTGCTSDETEYVTVQSCSSCPQTTLSSRVLSSADDAEQNLSSNAVTLNSTDLELGYDGTIPQMVGMRFRNISVPQGAIVTNAYIEFETDAVWSNATNLTISGQYANTTTTFTTAASNLSSRPKTTSTVGWTPSSWNTVSQKHQSPNIKNIVQEIVNRPGWASGNSMAMFITGTGRREAEAYDGEAANAPRLVITYERCIEICDNGIDDDNDGYADCADSECLLSSCFTNFNVVSFGPVNVQQSDIQGKALFCDNATLSNYSIGSSLTVGGTDTVVYVGGNFSLTNGSIQGGAIMATGSISLTNVTNQEGNSSGPAPTTIPNQARMPVECTAEEAFFTTLSNTFESYAQNGTFTISGTDKIFNCTNQTGTVVFNISLAADPYIFTYGQAILQNHTNASAIIINITHTDPVMHSMAFNTAFLDYSYKIIWNFPNANRLRFSAIGIKGSVLAPIANLVMENGHIDGNVITNGFVMSGGSNTLDHPNSNAGEFHLCKGGTDCGFSTYYRGSLPDIDYTGCEFHYPITPTLPSSNICIGDTFYLYPRKEVIWTSSNPAVASVDNNGRVIALAIGKTSFIYNSPGSSCLSDPTDSLEVRSLSSSLTGITALCSGSATTLTASGIGGTAPYSYRWSHSIVTTNTVSVSPATTTTYIVTVTDFNGCFGTSSLTVNVSPTPSISISGTNVLCSSASSTLTATASGGSGSGYTYLWSHSLGASNVVNVSPLTTTTYTVTITDSNGCTNTSSRTITVNNSPTGSISGTISICNGSSTNLTISGNGGSGSGYTYVWSDGLGTSPSVSVSPNATKIYSVTITDGNGCTGITNSTVIVNDNPTTTINGFTTICLGSSTTLTAVGSSGSGSGYSYTWNGGLGNNNSISVSPTTTTSYSVTMTDSNGCVATANETVTVNSSLNLSVNYNGSVCLTTNGTIGVNVSGGSSPYTYNWSGPSSFSGTTQSVNITNDGNYYVTVTDAVGCSANTTGFVYQRYDPTVVSLQTEVCEGQSVNLSVNSASAVSYLWSANASNATTSSVSVNPSFPSTTYSVTVTNNLGCTSVPTAGINVKARPVINITGNDSICIGATTTFSPSSGGSWISYNPSVATITNTGVVTAISAGNATFAFYDNTSTCTSVASIPVTVNPKPTVSITGSSAICVGTTTSLSPSTGGTWISSDANIATVDNNGIVTGVNEGNATFVFTSSTTACLSDPTAAINVDGEEGISITGDNSLCIGESTLLSASNPVGTWSSNDNAIATVNSSGVVTAISVGHAIIAFESPSGACLNESTFAIVVNSNPIVSVSGNDSVCIAATTSLLPATGGTWISNNTSIATVSNGGIVTGVSAGNTTFVFTNSVTGCVSSPTAALTVNPRPIVNITGADVLCIGGTTSLIPSSGGTWTSSNNSIATVTNSGIATAIDAGTVTFIYTSGTTGCSSNPSNSVLVNTRPTASITGATTICVGSTTTLSPSTGGTWESSNNLIATVSNAGYVVGVSAGAVTFTFTNSITGCISNPSNAVTVIAKPIISVPTQDLCIGYTTILSPTNGGVWYSNNNNVATISSTGIVTAIAEGMATFTYVSSTTGCTNTTSATPISVNSQPSVNIDYNGAVCYRPNMQLTAVPSNGTPNYTYTWTGPGGFTAISQNVNISLNGNYYVTLTDSKGCAASATGFVYQQYQPDITVLQTNVCEGESLILTANSPTAVSYQWGSNAGNVTTPSTLVYPAYPASIYKVTVTNDQGCTAVPEVTIGVTLRPSVNINVSNICVGTITNISPSGGGTWISSNPSIATVTNSGIVTGINAGIVKFVYTSSSTGCKSDSTAPLIVYPKPTVSITGPNAICINSSTTLSPGSGGSWTSNHPTIATVNNSGIVTGVAEGTATFTFISAATGCASNPTNTVQVDDHRGVTITGPSHVCVGSVIQLSASVPNGAWQSNNTNIITVTNSGFVTGVAAGVSTVTYQSNSGGCVENTSYSISVIEKPNVVVTGDTSICIGAVTTLLPSAGGIWISNNHTIASISSNGVVLGLNPGNATFTFINPQGCASNPSKQVQIKAKPVANIIGGNNVCLGSPTQLSPVSGGIWYSNNPTVASIANNGYVTTHKAGTAKFVFTDTNTGCVSDSSATMTVNPKPLLSLNYHGSVCLTDTSRITAIPTNGTPAYTYSWSGPNSFTSTLNSVLVNANGSYVVTVTDSKGCSASQSGFIYQRYDPIIINLQTSICEGKTLHLAVNSSSATSYQWSANAGNASTYQVDVYPSFPSSTYNVTVTNNLGCSHVASAIVNVHEKPDISLSGLDTLCLGESTNFLPSTGGIWSSTDPSIASITNNGTVTANAAGYAAFIFTNSTSGCSSDTSLFVKVNAPASIYPLGPSSICIGDTTYLFPSFGGVWTSSNTDIATVNNGGRVIAKDQGIVSFSFTNTSTGCLSNGSLNLTINSKPSVVLLGENNICINGNTQFAPSSGGTWSSNNSGIAVINNSGIVTGLSLGSTSFYFTDVTTGCKSVNTENVIVNNTTALGINGDTTICIGSYTQLTPSTGGIWSSYNPAIASISNNGTVTGISSGSALFSYTDLSTGCSSISSVPIVVRPRPFISLSGNSSICIGGTTNMLPSSGGTWNSNFPSIATITNNGLISALNSGLATFYFVDSITGCSSANSINITINDKPNAIISGPSTLCVGGITNLSPSSGGIWVSNNPSVATVNNSGYVSAVALGTATFTFTETSTGCVSNNSLPLNVDTKPTATITGNNIICLGNTTTLSPTSGGIWLSNNPSVANINNGGIVTGVSQGIATFTFITDGGCASSPSLPLVVNGKPTTSLIGLPNVCVGSTTQLLPNNGGSWSSLNDAVATISNIGVVTGVGAGETRFLFTDASTGCTSYPSAEVAVSDLPSTSLSGPNSICIGSSTQVFPVTGGIWFSNNSAIASVNNLGNVIGISNGQVTLTYIETNTGCTANLSTNITVYPKPPAIINGPQNICIGTNTTLSPNTGGVWISKSPSVASVNNFGTVTGLSAGTARFAFIQNSTGCTSNNTQPVIVNPKPSGLILGEDNVCIGTTTVLSPTNGGTWVSSDTTIATIDNHGVVTGVNIGEALFVYTDTSTDCTSDPVGQVFVNNSINVSVLGDSAICMDYPTQLYPNSGGFWTSSNPRIASVTSSGTVIAKAPGRTSCYFTESSTGCISRLPDNIIEVVNCKDPDFSVTLVDVEVFDNLNTNDEIPHGFYYSPNVITISKPQGSLPHLNINDDGSYSFKADKIGKYRYNVPVCILPQIVGCPLSLLEITVVDPLENEEYFVSNIDIGSVYEKEYLNDDKWVEMKSISNDKCVSISQCEVDTNMFNFIAMPNHGNVQAMNNAKSQYWPSLSYLGNDTISYGSCNGAYSNCISSSQIVTIMHKSAPNTISTTDDFYSALVGQTITGNVLENDSDPEDNDIKVTPLGSVTNPIISPEGTYYIDSLGHFSFTPNLNFTGPSSIAYQVCDNNLEDPICVKATAHLLILSELKLKVRVYLEGALMDNNGAVSSTGRPLMRDNIRKNPYTNNTNHLSMKDPYKYWMPNFDITNKYNFIGATNINNYDVITDSVNVMAVEGENAIVDWVFVEIRSKDDSTQVLTARSGLVQRDGDIVDIDGVNHLKFAGFIQDSFYVVVKHRSHLGVMSQIVGKSDLVDFTSINYPVFDFGTSLNNGYDYEGLATNNSILYGYRALWGGDFNGDGKIKFTNPFDDINYLFFDVLAHINNVSVNSNYDFALGYYQGDFNMNGKSKFDNPEDDKNLLFAQILLYPLNVNYLSNFDHFIQQIP